MAFACGKDVTFISTLSLVGCVTAGFEYCVPFVVSCQTGIDQQGWKELQPQNNTASVSPGAFTRLLETFFSVWSCVCLGLSTVAKDIVSFYHLKQQCGQEESSDSSSGDFIAHLDVFLGRFSTWSYLKVEASSFLLKARFCFAWFQMNY